MGVRSEGRTLHLEVEGKHSRGDVLQAVRWALRLDEDFAPLKALSKNDPLLRAALARGASRLLRAPTLWEEAARTLCTTNVQWAGTVAMMTGLVELGRGYFPSPAQVLEAGSGALRGTARMGYRAESLLALAERIDQGYDIERWKIATPRPAELAAEIGSWRGFGPYATSHLMVQLGHYGDLPIDSEVRAFHENLSDAQIRRRYASYGNYAFLVYKLRRIALKRNWIGDEVSAASTE